LANICVVFALLFYIPSSFSLVQRFRGVQLAVILILILASH